MKLICKVSPWLVAHGSTLDGVGIQDQLNAVIHEVMHMVIELPVSEEGKVVAISGVIQPRRRHR